MQIALLILLFISLFAGIATGIPVMFALLGSSVLVAAIASIFGTFDPNLLYALPVRIFGIMENQILYAVPLFILMGKILEHSDLAERSLSAIAGLFGKPTRSSIAISVIGVSVLIACSSGIVGATITMLAAIAIPVMTKAEIRERLSAGLIIASGSLGQIIPPSIVLILLSDQISAAYLSTQRELGNFSPEPVSVGHLFAGALIPGLVLAAAYAIYVLIQLKKKNLVSGRSTEGPANKDWMGLAAMLALISVPASILLGFTTPTEAAGVGVALLFILTAVNGKTDKLGKITLQTLELTGVIFGIILAASVFALVMRGLEGDRLVQQALSALPAGQFWALLVVMGVVFLLGFIMEFIEITYVVIPVATPALFAIGVDPIWFAILIALNLQISFLTPPMGVSLFYYKSVADISTREVVRAVLPFIAIQLLVLLGVAAFPALAVWLPSVLV